MTFSKILSALVTSFVILSIPMLIAIIYMGEEYVGVELKPFFIQFGMCVILLPFCAKFARCFFNKALEIPYQSGCATQFHCANKMDIPEKKKPVPKIKSK
jgi:hypothetical protein